MSQIPPPAPPAPPQSPRDLGDAIRRSVDDALAGALAAPRAALQQEIARMRAERQGLEAALQNAPNGAARREIQREIARLDNRIHEAETGLEKIDARLSTRDEARVTETHQPPPLFPDRPMDNFNPAPMVISIMAILFIGFPLAVTIARLIWKRTSNAPPPALNVETARRFDRLEQSVDAIAIEVERISENQRYLTRLLAEPKQGAKLGS